MLSVRAFPLRSASLMLTMCFSFCFKFTSTSNTTHRPPRHPRSRDPTTHTYLTFNRRPCAHRTTTTPYYPPPQRLSPPHPLRLRSNLPSPSPPERPPHPPLRPNRILHEHRIRRLRHLTYRTSPARERESVLRRCRARTCVL